MSRFDIRKSVLLILFVNDFVEALVGFFRVDASFGFFCFSVEFESSPSPLFVSERKLVYMGFGRENNNLFFSLRV